MNNVLKNTLTRLEKLNNTFDKKLLNDNQITEVKDYINDLSDTKEEIQNLLNKLNKANPNDIDLIIEILIHLHLKFDNSIACIDSMRDLIKQMQNYCKDK